MFGGTLYISLLLVLPTCVQRCILQFFGFAKYQTFAAATSRFRLRVWRTLSARTFQLFWQPLPFGVDITNIVFFSGPWIHPTRTEVSCPGGATADVRSQQRAERRRRREERFTPQTLIIITLSLLSAREALAVDWVDRYTLLCHCKLLDLLLLTFNCGWVRVRAAARAERSAATHTGRVKG